MTLGIHMLPQTPGAASGSVAYAPMRVLSRPSPASKGHVPCPLVSGRLSLYFRTTSTAETMA
ncbi:hypothetical protein SAMN05880556_101944 [Azospirillum sp. RU38E]|nr:hypothetical protein SAMN05880556_101944 [Azospirillum sp. RU38E]SNS15828.1 hypothetical protein SAMN05880591_101944 [Azospirillum sp. RU37A]